MLQETSTTPQLTVSRMGNGRPLLLLHGIQGTSSSWLPVARQLLDWHCVLPNLPGRLDAVRVDESLASSIYNVDHFADLMQSLVVSEAERSGCAVQLAGWSMGVSVLLRMWERHGGEHIDRMALLSGTPIPAEAHWFRSNVIADIEVEAQARAKALRLASVADPQAVAWSLLSARTLDQRGMLGSIDKPTLVLHGARDEQSPLAHGQLMACAIPSAQLVQLDEVGHAVLSEATDLVAAHLRSFFLG